jgi:hypothetical protein
MEEKKNISLANDSKMESLYDDARSGFGYQQLKFCRQFYHTFPIGNTLCSQLNWSQYRRLIQIDDPNKCEYYELLWKSGNY